MAEQQSDRRTVWTILEMIRWGTQYFADRGIDSPRLTIELIVCAATGLERVGLYTNFEKPLAAPELDSIRSAVRRRLRREPLQYILGTAHFYGLPLAVGPGVLIPRPETELLVEHIVKRARAHPAATILDIGTGSGCIALALARHLPDARVLALDAEERALEVARGNARALGLEERVEFRRCDILRELPTGRFDVVVSNPPYIPGADIATLEPEVREYEPRSALEAGADGLVFYRRFAEIFPAMLTPGGAFCVEIGYGQHEAVCDLFGAAGLPARAFSDYAGILRHVYGEAQGNSPV